MFVNSKPYIVENKNYQTMSYVVGISQDEDQFDQTIDTFALRPGYHLSLNILPEEIDATERFNQLQREVRKCKLPDENESMILFKNYTRRKCRFECSVSHALQKCKCWALAMELSK